METKKTKKRKMVDITGPAKKHSAVHAEKEKAKDEPLKNNEPVLVEKTDIAVISEESMSAATPDFLITRKTNDKDFFSNAIFKDLKEVDDHIEEEMEDVDQKIEEFEKEEKETFKQDDVKLREEGSKLKSYLLFFALLLISGGLLWLVIFVLPKAKIEISLKREVWKFEDTVIASKNQNQTDSNKKMIAAEVLPMKKNFSFPFPATGKKNVSRKATATIKIWNNFSTAPQNLVATTRFATPDGKIFRLDKTTTVPGAKMQGGKLVSDFVIATVTANDAGPTYNVGPFEKLTIPGFQGTPKYEKFYASMENAAANGLIGETAYPTDADIKLAKEKSASEIEKQIQFFLTSQLPSDVKILDSAKKFTIIKQEVNSNTDEAGNFTVFVEAEISAIGFKEADLLGLMETLAEKDLKFGKIIKDHSLDYVSSVFNEKSGELTLKINYSANYVPEFNANAIKDSLLGKKEKDLRLSIYNLPEVEKASVSFWPLWVKTVPKNSEKVSITVD